MRGYKSDSRNKNIIRKQWIYRTPLHMTFRVFSCLRKYILLTYRRMRTESARLGKLRAICLVVLSLGLGVIIIRSVLERHSIDYACPLDCSEYLKSNRSRSAQSSSTLSKSNYLSEWDYNWDFKAPKGSAARSSAERILILIRHGKYDFTSGKLNELGRYQADLTGQRLRAMNLSYQSIIHSTMDRAVETAQIIYKHLAHLPISSDEMIVEGGPVPPSPTVPYWNLPDRNYFVDGPRMEAAFRKYFYRPDPSQTRNTYQILVGHGNIFRFFTLRALQMPKDAWMRVFIAHASITQIFLRSDGTVATSLFGDAGHLPFDKVTY